MLLLSICTEINDWKKKLQKYSLCSSINGWIERRSIPGSPYERYPIVEDVLTLNILLYDIDIVDGNIIGEFARPSVQKYENNMRLLRFNNHVCYVNNINAVFQSFCCPKIDTFFSRRCTLERHLTTCSERVKNVYPRKVYQIRETLFDKLDSFGIKYTSEQKLFKN